MYLGINKWVIAVKVSKFSGQYFRNRSTLDIGVLGYIGIVWPKEHSPEVWSVPPVTPCTYVTFWTFVVCFPHNCVALRTGSQASALCRQVLKITDANISFGILSRSFRVTIYQITSQSRRGGFISGRFRKVTAADVLNVWIKTRNSEINPTRCNNCVYSSQWLYSTCFGWQFHPSSGVQCCIWPFR